MEIVVALCTPAGLAEYASISSWLDVRSTFDIVPAETKGAPPALHERSVAEPWRKNYDEGGHGPQDWSARFDLSTWELLAARADNVLVGAAVLVPRAHDAGMLAERRDTALLWDLRVASLVRRQRVGAKLVAVAEGQAIRHGAQSLVVETQNVNVPACRFYAACGFTLASIDSRAYSELPAEVQLIWQKRVMLEPNGR